jgi:cell division control protein 6
MSFLDFLLPKKESEDHSSTKESPSIPKAIRDLQDSLSPSDVPTSRKRDRSAKKEPVAPLSASKKKKLQSTQLATPETTPIHKSSEISVISPASVDRRGVKKLDFALKEVPEVKKEINIDDILATPPSTPTKERVIAVVDDKENALPTPQKTLSIYVRAKALFQRSAPVNFSGILPERELEANALQNFLVSHITARQASSLYVSGPPGTGKTAQLKLTLSQFIDMDSTEKLQEVEIDGNDYKMGYSYINCMTVNKTSNIYSEIYRSLTGERIHINESKEKLHTFLSSKKAHMSVIILDELDQMLGKQRDEVFTLFSWALTCNIILIGISNALDMVDKLLPRLKMNGLSPNSLVFMPYTADQIARIIQMKLNQLEDKGEKIQLFHPAAIKLCSKKSASNTGDLRKAFDICRTAIESVEKEARGSNIIQFKDAPLNTVQIQHIARVTNAVFNANPTKKLKNLNLSQKFLVCMLVKAEASNPFQTLSVNSFYEYYTKNGKIDQLIGLLRKTEFLEVMSSLEANSVIRIHKSNKAFSDSKVSSSIVKKDLAGVIKGIHALEKLMATNDV